MGRGGEVRGEEVAEVRDDRAGGAYRRRVVGRPLWHALRRDMLGEVSMSCFRQRSSSFGEGDPFTSAFAFCKFLMLWRVEQGS